MATNSIILSLQNLSVVFKDRDILKNVSLDFLQGNIFCITGTNGSGKSTLLKCIIGENKYAGNILYKGHSSSKYAILNEVSYLPEKIVTESTLTVYELMKYYLLFHNYPMNKVDSCILLIARTININAVLNESSDKLSKGTLQKIYFLLALMIKPQLMLLDEPFDGLDEESKTLFKNLLLKYREHGGTVIFTSHDHTMVEEISDYIYDLNSNRMVSNTKLSKGSDYDHKDFIALLEFLYV